MAKNKINPLLLMLPGVLLIVAAMVGHFGGFFSDDEVDDAPSAADLAMVTAEPAPPKKIPKQAVVAAAKTSKKSVDAPKPARSPSEDRAEMTKILLAQIRKSPDTLDLGWLSSFCQFVDDESSFQQYFADILRAGEKRYDTYASRQQRGNREPTSNPHFFLEEAKRTLFSKKASADKMAKHGLSWLAAAYYKEHDLKGGWEFVDDGFMTAFFKQSIGLYSALADTARAQNRSVKRSQEALLRAHEANVMDRFLRIKNARRIARDRLTKTSNSGARVQLNQDRMQQQINSSLLALGHYYLTEAKNESGDIRRLRYFAEQTFQAMAMVYQRKPSSAALTALREVNEVQRSYLYRMALVSWQNARKAAEEGHRKDADDLYFTANRHYLQCMTRWGEVDRESHQDEFRRLKQEISLWQREKRRGVTDGST